MCSARSAGVGCLGAGSPRGRCASPTGASASVVGDQGHVHRDRHVELVVDEVVQEEVELEVEAQVDLLVVCH